MKTILIFVNIIFSSQFIGQENGLGIKYSLYFDTPEDLKTNNISSSFKIFYTNQGIIRYIENNNNYIQACIFNVKNNKLIIFDKNGSSKKYPINFNQPDLIEIEETSGDIITFYTKTGNYTYYYNEQPKINSTLYNQYQEHCFNLFINKTNVLPQKTLYEFLNYKIITQQIQSKQLTPVEVALLNKVIKKPNKNNIKLFIQFSKKQLN